MKKPDEAIMFRLCVDLWAVYENRDNTGEIVPGHFYRTGTVYRPTRPLHGYGADGRKINRKEQEALEVVLEHFSDLIPEGVVIHKNRDAYEAWRDDRDQPEAGRVGP